MRTRGFRSAARSRGPAQRPGHRARRWWPRAAAVLTLAAVAYLRGRRAVGDWSTGRRSRLTGEPPVEETVESATVEAATVATRRRLAPRSDARSTPMIGTTTSHRTATPLAGVGSLAVELDRLALLLHRGAINDAEYETAKREVLDLG